MAALISTPHRCLQLIHICPLRSSTDTHFRGGEAATAQYLLALDALNFCFWPQPGLEYEHLARGLKASSPIVCIHNLTLMSGYM